MSLQSLINLVASLSLLALFFWLRGLEGSLDRLNYASRQAFSAVDHNFKLLQGAKVAPVPTHEDVCEGCGKGCPHD